MSPRKNFNDRRGFSFSQLQIMTKLPSLMRTEPSGDVAKKASLLSKRKSQYEDDQESKFHDSKSTRMRMTTNPNIGTGRLSMDQIKDHLLGLQQFGNEQGVDLANSTTDKQCKLCGLSTLTLAPQPKLCAACDLVIKNNATYHRTAELVPSEQLNFCHKCFNQCRKSITFIDGRCFPKKTLVSTKNLDKIPESFVQCDTCGEWNHQICGLHNSFQEETYKCPKCQLREMTNLSSGVSFFCAKDLPQTQLGNFIEQRLSRRLQEDRKERAVASGKPLTERVPGAEDLFVRVVLSVKKKSTVGDKLSSVLIDYPKEFPYTLKMILLFQKIGGVDVCLFSMYVQEYGTECRQPNQRYCYISYIDSVKYFTPDISTSTGEALRTFAYHQVLIGYMDYAKKRGFTRCFLWSCPPLKGDEYVFNSRPVSQKAPNSDRLRLWYQKMLKKASAEGIVVNHSTLYDRFFLQTGDSSRRISLAHLPHFEGDYWPGVVEKLLMEMEKEELCNKNRRERTKTSLKVMGLANILDKDSMLMHKLEFYILPCKEDFMVIDLQYFCARCHEPILFGKRWLWNEPNNSYLCQRCHNQHHTSSKLAQNSTFELVVPVPINIEDKDGTIENEKCESRQKFLKFCQENKYQFDTLRRTKHSSLMILHHLCLRARSKSVLSEEQRLELIEIIEHVSRCTTYCGDQKCEAIKGMFVHSTKCNVKADKGCLVCRKVWYILGSHSNLCTQPNCTMPYCKELKNKE